MQLKMMLDGGWVSLTPGQTILEVARSAGVHIPTLCHYQEADHKDICRICVVEVEGSDRLFPACSTQAREGMEVWTLTERVAISRRRTIDMLLATGRHICITCDANGDCRLQDLAYAHGATIAVSLPPSETFPEAYDGAFIHRDYSKCILCGRCYAACNDVQVYGAIKNPFGRRDDHPRPEGWFPLPDPAKCVECGQCVEACPVGALREKSARGAARPWEADKVRTTCPRCGVGCQQLVHVKDGRIAKVTAVHGSAPNRGRLCVKGRFINDISYGSRRFFTPRIKKKGRLRKATREEALDLVASRLKAIIRQHGPDAVAGISFARATNEDIYNMQKLFRAVIGTNNIDNQGATAGGLGISFGIGATTNSFTELAEARMIFCIGADMATANPVAASFVKNAARGGAELIVAGHEPGQLAGHAKLYAKLHARSEAAFIYGLIHVILSEDLYDKGFVRDRCDGFEEFRASVLKYAPERVGEACGVDADTIRLTARRFASVRPAMACYSPGNSGPVRDVEVSLANLQMLLGNIGDGGGVSILSGRNNAQGASDMGARPDMLTGHQKVTDPVVREKFAQTWRISGLPEKPGLSFSRMLDGLVDGSVKALYCFGEDPAGNSPEFKKALASAEFVVCQDTTLTETSSMAHVVLPSAAWGEDDGSYTNSERRVSRVRRFKEPAGLASPGWWIFQEIARRMGHEWASAGAQEIWDNEISAISPMFGGIKYSRMEADGIQWPCSTSEHPGTPVLHKDGDFIRGKGLFIPCE